MDAALIEQLMGDEAVQMFRIGRDGSSICVFALGQ
jgi:hypothetical protein